MSIVSPASAALANRSFLYGAGGGAAARPAAPAVDGAEIVYATLDSLGLRLQPPTALLDGPAPRQPTKVGPATLPKPKSKQEAIPAIEAIEIALTSSPLPGQRAEPRRGQAHLQAFDSESDSTNQSSGSLERSSPAPAGRAKQPKKKPAGQSKERLTFAKNVLYYVPLTSRRYYRKSRKLASKSLSLKSLGAGGEFDSANQSLKARSLSRDELKYVTISLPSNFVHVASATRDSLTPDAPVDEARLQLITHKAAYADLRTAEYADVLRGARHAKPANDSFLWGKLAKPGETPEDDDYDDVGPALQQSLESEKYETDADASHSREEENKKKQQQQQQQPERVDATGENEGVDDEYDDVIPVEQLTSCSSVANEPLEAPTISSVDEDDVYDDVGFSANYEEPAEKSEAANESANPELEEREEQVDEDVYDDVGFPLRLKSHESHERVNSLYAGSSICNYHDKESEWEDLEELANYDDSGVKIEETSHSSPCKKKLAGQRWSRKVRRQRSRASRKSSGRSTSRSRTRPKNSETRSMAVSLGAGSILLLGAIDDGSAKDRQPLPTDNAETKGLVQLRFVLLDEENDVQESSLYVEDSSDDSNYETLETFEPDDFSSDSEPETSRPRAPEGHQEPPNRPVPPPPREASLGHTFGRRMKMLRRTWSITKGSLGRIRRRASGDCEAGLQQQQQQHQQTELSPNGSADPRKYFSFKKHFRKSQATGLSTFYLDKMPPDSDKPKEDEPIYSNSNWYQEAGLYRAQQQQQKQQQQEAKKSEVLAEQPDHYSVLAEEPLYQFYTAAATRVAFESDSDGYEEVEELTPSSVTTDLAKPGHRTLWCQTPRVINSGLLQKLTAEERKIQEAKFEILTSEASYLNSLRVLENEFSSNHELVHEVLSSSERERLFGAVPDVLVASERFLAELEAVWREDPMLGRLTELLLKHAERSADVYVNYCSNQVSIDTTLKDLRAKKGHKFLEAVSRIETRPACQNLLLHSFLMLPMQRITRLPLLADAVLSKLSVEHSERLSWEAVLTAFSHVVSKCNEGARLAERRNEMDALARKLEYPSKVLPVDLRDRELIRSGTVVQLSTKSDTEYKLTFGKKFHKTPLMLMLLTDYLLVTKLKSNSNEDTYSVIDTCKRSLVALESAPEDSPFAGRHAMVLTLLENHAARQVEYVLTCENETEKERWLDAVSPPKPTCVGETLYESWDCPQVMAVYSHVPSQPDELTLQPGDVINVLRKMNDGWLFGEKLLDGEQGWFPGNFTKEVASEHVRARNLHQRHRFLALSGSVLQRKAKQSLL